MTPIDFATLGLQALFELTIPDDDEMDDIVAMLDTVASTTE